MKWPYKYSPATFVSPRHFASLHWQSFLAGLSGRYARVVREESVRACFVVGCGHSGTTLVAGKLGNLPEVYAMGYETNAFFPKVGLYASAMLIYHWKQMAKAAGKSILLEKTPKHVQRISAIKSILPEARFVMMLRNPLDNVASLYKRTGDLDYAIRRWVTDAKPAIRYAESDYVHIVRYENLTAQPEVAMRAICEFLGVGYSVSAVAAGPTAFAAHKELIDPRIADQRVKGVSEPIRRRSGSWRSCLTSDQAATVRKHTAQVSAWLGYDQGDLAPSAPSFTV